MLSWMLCTYWCTMGSVTHTLRMATSEKLTAE
jgi:hypothetical protein